ncbi:hypothetical protein [Anabaena sp. CCY 0017]
MKKFFLLTVSAIKLKTGYWLWLLAIALLNVHVWVSTSHKPIKPTPEI